MKSVLTMLVLTICLSNIALASNKETSRGYSSKEAMEVTSDAKSAVPLYWEGVAKGKSGLYTAQLTIKVYQSANLCNSFYAIATKVWWGGQAPTNAISEELVVKPAPENCRLGNYYVTYKL